MSTRTHPVESASTESDEVVSWRYDQLRAHGFEPVLADRLAANCSVDLHDLIRLVEDGCPPAVAARILAPLPGEPRPC